MSTETPETPRMTAEERASKIIYDHDGKGGRALHAGIVAHLTEAEAAAEATVREQIREAIRQKAKRWEDTRKRSSNVDGYVDGIIDACTDILADYLLATAPPPQDRPAEP